jgi:hypothetical protein
MRRRPQHLPEFVRFEGGAMHIDAEKYAKARGITLEVAVREIRELMAVLLPDAEVTEL